MTDIQEPPTPQHDKFRPHAEEARVIGGFLEWLDAQQVHLMQWKEVGVDHVCPKRDNGDMGNSYAPNEVCVDGQLYDRGFRQRDAWKLIGTCPRCEGESYWQSKKEDWTYWGKNIQEIIALFYEIDKKAFDDETEAIFNALRELANTK